MNMRMTKAVSLKMLRDCGLSIGTVIDVGVHHHTPELIKAFPDIPHLLFEPVTEYHVDIKTNYKDIDFTLFPMALASQSSEGFLRTFDVTGKGGITHSSISTTGGGDARHIQMAALDDVLKSRADTKPYLLKIDVDGAELQILAGAKNTIRDCCCVVIECPISIDHNMFFDRANFLKQNDFVLWDIVDFCYYKDQLSQVDLVFINQNIKPGILSPWNQGAFDATKWNTMFQNNNS